LSQKLSRTIGIYRAKELSLTGNFLSASQAAEWGLVNRVVAPNELLPACRKLGEDMLSLVPACLSGYKKLIDQGYAENFGEALKTELRVSGAANKVVRSADVEARREAIRQRGQAQKG
jgi:enoyl-CoA hydratase